MLDILSFSIPLHSNKKWNSSPKILLLHLVQMRCRYCTVLPSIDSFLNHSWSTGSVLMTSRPDTSLQDGLSKETDVCLCGNIPCDTYVICMFSCPCSKTETGRWWVFHFSCSKIWRHLIMKRTLLLVKSWMLLGSKLLGILHLGCSSWVGWTVVKFMWGFRHTR